MKRCVTKRKEANQHCLNAGAKSIDAGHQKAVKFCEDRQKEWEAEPINPV